MTREEAGPVPKALMVAGISAVAVGKIVADRRRNSRPLQEVGDA